MNKTLTETFSNFHFISKLKKNETGDKILFTVHTPDMENNSYRSHIWCLDKKTKKYKQLTSMGDERDFSFLDNDSILFASNIRNRKNNGDEDKTAFYKLNINSGEAREFFTVPKTVTSIEYIKNSNYLITVYEKKYGRMKEDDECFILEEIPFWANGDGIISNYRNKLYLLNSKTDSLKQLTPDIMSVEIFHYEKNTNRIAIIGNSFESKMPTENKIFSFDLDKNELNDISPYMNFMYLDLHSIDKNKYLVLGTDMKKLGVVENPKLFVLETIFEKNDEIPHKLKCITPELDISIGNFVLSDCKYSSSGESLLKKYGEELYFLFTENENCILSKTDYSGNIKSVIKENGSIEEFIIYDDEIISISFRDNRLPEIYSHKNGKPLKLTDFNKSDSNTDTIIPGKVSIKISEKHSMDGWVIKPRNYDHMKKYPGILNIHGGPTVNYGDIYYHEMQYWADNGYFVFFCNPRGSSGKGNEYADILGKYGTVDYDDIMFFTDEVLKKYPSIDEKRIGVTGGSYGGFMTNWIISHTQRFKAAVSQRSVSNWITKFCNSDVGYSCVGDLLGSDPWNDFHNLWKQSPLKYAERIKTPTLFIHSYEDYRCCVEEGLQMFSALKYHQVESKLIIFKNENHNLSRKGKPHARINRLKEITNWFDKHIKNYNR